MSYLGRVMGGCYNSCAGPSWPARSADAIVEGRDRQRARAIDCDRIRGDHVDAARAVDESVKSIRLTGR